MFPNSTSTVLEDRKFRPIPIDHHFKVIAAVRIPHIDLPARNGTAYWFYPANPLTIGQVLSQSIRATQPRIIWRIFCRTKSNVNSEVISERR